MLFMRFTGSQRCTVTEFSQRSFPAQLNCAQHEKFTGTRASRSHPWNYMGSLELCGTAALQAQRIKYWQSYTVLT